MLACDLMRATARRDCKGLHIFTDDPTSAVASARALRRYCWRRPAMHGIALSRAQVGVVFTTDRSRELQNRNSTAKMKLHNYTNSANRFLRTEDSDVQTRHELHGRLDV